MFLLQVLLISPLSIIPPVLHSHFYLRVAPTGRKKRTKPGDLPTNSAFSEIENVWKEKYFQNKTVYYRDADKSLARPGRKQATATEDFDFHISYL